MTMVSVLLLSCAEKQPEPVIAEPEPLPFEFDGNLLAIDTLLQTDAGDALQKLLSFDTQSVIFNENYHKLLLSEALYKTDNPQDGFVETHGRASLQAAMQYFDSLAAQYPADDDLAVLAARSHYMNGVGYYENDSVVEACKEYLETLDLMENHFKDNDFVGYKAKFMTLTYNRLVDLFSSQFMMEPAIYCAQKSMHFCMIEPTSKYGLSNTIFKLGKYNDMLGKKDSAYQYYNQALEHLPDTNNRIYRDIVSNMALLSYELDCDTEKTINDFEKIMKQTRNDEEILSRYIGIGYIYYNEGLYDSAIVYLKHVFENKSTDVMKLKAAEYLQNIYQSTNNYEEADKYSKYLATNITSKYGDMMEVSILDKLFYDYLEQIKYNKRQREIIDKNRHRRTNIIVISTTVLVFVFVLLYFRKKKRITIPESFNERCAQFEQTEIFRNIRGRLSANNEKMSIKNIDGKSDMALTGADLMTLRTAVDKHFDNLTQRLARQYPELNATDINCLCLALIGLSNVEIAALLGVKYNSLTNRITRLKKILKTEDNIRIFLTEMQN